MANNTSRADSKFDPLRQTPFVNQMYNTGSIEELQKMKAEQDARNAAMHANGKGKNKSDKWYAKLADSVLQGLSQRRI